MLTAALVWLDISLILLALIFVAPRVARIAICLPLWLLSIAVAVALLPVNLLTRLVRTTNREAP